MDLLSGGTTEVQDSHKGFVAVIPARGGSVGLPRKNILEVQGISLIARAVLIAEKIKEIRWLIVSTDDREIALEAERAGAEIPFLRPKALARSNTPMLAVLKHAFEWLQDSKTFGDNACEGLVLLQPTSPMRKTEHVVGAIKRYREARTRNKNIAGVQTVSPVPDAYSAPNLWQSGHIAKLMEWAKLPAVKLRRTGRFSKGTNLYYRNGAAVVLDTKKLEALNLLSGAVMPYVIDQPLMTIDTIFDLLRIEHCAGNLEPDPREIGWKSVFNADARKRK
jgi:CMP-N-acetylneuraminic acid synthetase